ncbi:MAG: hypothetical protein ACO2PM_18660 [Pyrobaculum sp.]|jgi:hypothetical protein
MLESGAAAGDLLAATRDERVYIDEVFDEVEGGRGTRRFWRRF